MRSLGVVSFAAVAACIVPSEAFRFRLQSNSLANPIDDYQKKLEEKTMEKITAEDTIDCEALKQEMLAAAREPILTEEEQKVHCEKETEEEARNVPLLQRSKSKPQIMEACLEMQKEIALEKRREQRDREKKLKRCPSLIETITSVHETSVIDGRRDKAEELGVDLTDDELKNLSDESLLDLERAYAALKSCDHDFSHLCPFGWKDLGDETTCEAPEGYKGSCKQQENFALSNEEKIEKEKTCLVSWPCLDECERDYSLECPTEWTGVGGGKCAAPFSYSGHCKRELDFSVIGAADKKTMSLSCGFKFPCKPACKRDYDLLCPKDWTADAAGKCNAPEEYKGNCSKTQDLTAFTPDMKPAFEEKCKVVFPCKTRCDRDYDVLCPKSWVNSSEQKCVPDADYGGPCNAETDFASLSEKDKRQFEDRCGTEWPCRGEICDRDYDEDCPLEWTKTGSACLAPMSYRGPCEESQPFLHLPQDAKEAAAEKCQVEWPCKNGEVLLQDMLLGGPGRDVRRKIHLGRATLGGPIEEGSGKIVEV